MSPPDGMMAPDAGVGAQPSGRTDRPPLLAFATDAETEDALRRGLAETATEGSVRRGDIGTAIAALRKTATPLSLVVDVTGHPQPISALEDLAQVLEPDVRVFVIGDREDLSFYRHMTRQLGVLDYLFKPVTPAVIAQHFAPLLTPRTGAGASARAGRIIAVTGTRGGVGATTIATNLAWYLADQVQRHTALLDADLHTGTAAMLLGVEPGAGLRAALENPSRIDELFVERAGTRVGTRLQLLAAEEKLTEQPGYFAGAAEKLAAALQRRCNYIVVDLPFAATPLHQELLALAHQRIVVMDPSLASVRDALRLLQLQGGVAQLRRPVLALNRAGRRGGLAQRELVQALGQEIDVVFPDLPRVIEDAATLGKPAAAASGAFRAAIGRLAEEAGAVRAPQSTVKRGLFGRFRR